MLQKIGLAEQNFGVLRRNLEEVVIGNKSTFLCLEMWRISVINIFFFIEFVIIYRIDHLIGGKKVMIVGASTAVFTCNVCRMLSLTDFTCTGYY